MATVIYAALVDSVPQAFTWNAYREIQQLLRRPLLVRVQEVARKAGLASLELVDQVHCNTKFREQPPQLLQTTRKSGTRFRLSGTPITHEKHESGALLSQILRIVQQIRVIISIQVRRDKAFHEINLISLFFSVALEVHLAPLNVLHFYQAEAPHSHCIIKVLK